MIISAWWLRKAAN